MEYERPVSPTDGADAPAQASGLRRRQGRRGRFVAQHPQAQQDSRPVTAARPLRGRLASGRAPIAVPTSCPSQCMATLNGRSASQNAGRVTHGLGKTELRCGILSCMNDSNWPEGPRTVASFPDPAVNRAVIQSIRNLCGIMKDGFWELTDTERLQKLVEYAGATGRRPLSAGAQSGNQCRLRHRDVGKPGNGNARGRHC